MSQTERSPVEEFIIDRLGEEQLESLTDEGIEKLRETYREASEEYDSEKFAKAAAARQFNFDRYVAAAEKIRFNTIGASGPRPFGDQDAAFLYGVALPDDDPMGACVVLVTERDMSDMTLTELVEQFSEPGQPFDFDLDIRPAEVVGDAYVGEIPEGETAGDMIESPDASEVAPEGERFARVRQVTDAVDVFSIGENLSMQDDGYAADFGVDLKRIDPVSITSSQVTENGARYEMQDDSFLDAEVELDESITGTEDKAAGLVGWAEPEVMALETGSMCDSVFGTVDANDEGQIEMSIVGYIPENVEEADIRSTSSDDSGGSSGGNASGEAIEDRQI